MMANVSDHTTTCRNCGTAPAPGSPLGLCPACLTARMLDAPREKPENEFPEAGAEAALFDKYDLTGEVARGGMGNILRANDRKLGRTVAMKMMRLEASASEEARQRFTREALVLARLDHPNIVPLHELGKDDHGRPYYTMKLVEGETLQDILRRLAQSDEATMRQYHLDRLLTIFRKVCDALAFAHDRGIIHRDLKPENIMVGRYGEVLVMDWGLAKFVETTTPKVTECRVTEDGTEVMEKKTPTRLKGWSDPAFRKVSADVTLDGSVVGTPRYMSPEQARGLVDQLDQRSDVFSLGAILYTILTLRPPVEGESVEEILGNIAKANIRPPSSLSRVGTKGACGKTTAGVLAPAVGEKLAVLPHCPGGRVPSALSAVAMRALARRPRDRYQTVAALAADIEAFQGGFATTAEHVGAFGQLWLWMKRHKPVSVSAIVICILSFGFMVQLLRSEGTARRNAQRAVEESGRARAAEKKSLKHAADMRRALATAYVTEGWKDHNEGWWFRSLNIFTRALELEADDPERTAINRMRLGAVLNECPGLLQFFAPGNTVTAADFSQADAGGTRVALAFITTNGTFEAGVWGANEGRLLTQSMPHSGRINSIRFDPPGNRVVTASDDKTLRVWDARTGLALTKPMRHGEAVWEAAFSPNGRWIASVDNHRPGSWGSGSGPENQVYRSRVGTTVLWDATSGETRWTNQAEGRNGQRLVFSPDNSCLATGNRNFVGGLEEVTTGETRQGFPDTWWINDIVYSPAGDRVLVCGLWTRGVEPGARLFAADTLAPLGNLLPHDQEPTCGIFSLDGRLCVTGSRDRTVRIWECATGRAAMPPLVHRGEITRLAFSRDGGLLATGCNNGDARVWNPRTGEPLSPWLPHDGSIIALNFSRAGNRLFTASADGVRAWDLRAGSAPRHTVGFPNQQAQFFGFDQSGRHFFSLHRDGTVQLWSIANGRLAEAPQHLDEDAYAVGYDAERRWFFRFRAGEGVRAISLKDGRVAAETLPPEQRLLNDHVRWSTDGQWIAVRSDKVFRICHARDGQIRHEIRSASAAIVVPWVAHGDSLAIVTAGPEIQLFNFASDASRWTITHGKQRIPDLGFSPDGTRLFVVGTDEPARVYDSATGRPLTPPLRHGGVPSVAAFSPDGTRLATGSADGTVRVWRASDGEPLTAWLRHRDNVARVRFSRDGRLLITTSQDGTTIIRDAATGDFVTPPLEHGSRVNAAEISPDGVHLLTRTRDLSLRLWRLPEENARFSAADWRLTCRLFGGSENRPEPGAPVISPAEQASQWRRLFATYPEEFQFSEEQYRGWFEKSAWSAWGNKDWDKARRDFSRLVTNDPDAPNYRMLRGIAALRTAAAATSGIRQNLLKQTQADMTRALEWLHAAGMHSDKVHYQLLDSRFQARFALGHYADARMDFAALHGISLEPAPGTNFINLATWFNERSPADQTETRGSLSSLFERRVAMLPPANGVAFDLRGLIQLRGNQSLAPLHHPAQVTGIPVGRPCSRLHFLHGHAFNVPNRTEVGTYVIHYAGGGSEIIPLISGRNIGTWAMRSDAAQRAPAAVEISLSETGESNRRGYRHRLLLFTWNNSHPEQVIATIDFISLETAAAPFLVAVSAE